MAKKKNSPKKHKFKHVEAVEGSTQTVAAVSTDGVVSSSAPVRTTTAHLAVHGGRDFSYVKKDVRRIGMMVGTLVLVELLFYYLLEFTSVGGVIYHIAGA